MNFARAGWACKEHQQITDDREIVKTEMEPKSMTILENFKICQDIQF
jgi:hypothetical protein